MRYQIKREDGSYSEYKNAEFIPAFLMIPEELLKRCGKTLYELPRTRAALLGDRAVIRQVESDLFLECIVDAYAYMACRTWDKRVGWRTGPATAPVGASRMPLHCGSTS